MKLVKVYIEVVSDDFEWVTSVIEKTRDWETDRSLSILSTFLSITKPCEGDIQTVKEVMSGLKEYYVTTYDFYSVVIRKEFCQLIEECVSKEYADQGLDTFEIKTEDYLEILKTWISEYKRLKPGLY
ncbi:MAG: hypothetical protein U0Z75_09390 [Deinococcaceae bacterium]